MVETVETDDQQEGTCRKEDENDNWVNIFC
jgi:hypothetical protein